VSKAKNTPPLWVLALHATEMSAVEFRVWMYLWWRQGKNNSGWPSQAMIAADLGLTVESVRRITKRLRVTGWLLVEWSKGPGRGKEHRKQYTVTQPPKTPTSIGVSIHEKTQPAIGVLATENPTSRTAKTPPAVPTKKVGIRRKNTYKNTFMANQGKKVAYDWAGFAFVGISKDLVRQWSEAYPLIDARAEILKAAAWCRTNERKARKRIDWMRFLGGWMARAQARAEVPGQSTAQGQQWSDPDDIPLDAFRAGVEAIGGAS